MQPVCSRPRLNFLIKFNLLSDQQLAGSEYLQPRHSAPRHLSPLHPDHDHLLGRHDPLIQTER